MKLDIRKLGRKLLASATIAIALVALSGVSAQAAPSDNATILARVNSYRAAVSVSAVTEDANLDQLAQARADDAARANIIQHDVNYWYYNLGPSVSSFAELLAQGLPATSVATAWYQSGSHYPYMVGIDFTKVGIGFATSAQGQNFAVMVLTKPASTSSAAPDVPQGVTAAYGQGAVTASWTASATGSPSNYLAYLYSDGQQIDSSFVPASSTSASFANVALGKNYSVTVQAFRSSDGRSSVESAPSAPVLAPAKVADAPSTNPIVLNAGNFTFSWNAPSANGASISGYLLHIMRDGQEVEARVLNATSYAYTPQVSGEYSFAVAAVNSVGTSAFASSQSRTLTLAVQQPTLPSTPRPVTNLTLTERNGAVQASWGAPVNSVVNGYVVSIYLGGSLQQRVETEATSFTSPLPTSGTGVLSFTIVAKNVAGLGASSDTSFNYANVSAPPAVATPPASVAVTPTGTTTATPSTTPVSAAKPPALVTAKPKPVLPRTVAKPSLSAKAHGSLLVRWVAAKVQGAKVTKYQVRVVSGTKTKVYTTAASARTVIVGGLPKQKLAKVWVRAYNANGWGAYSSFKSIKTKR